MANEKKQLRERECAMCGKKFIFHDYWAYKAMNESRNKTKLFCSWSCLRKYENEKEKKRA